jgi:glycosyltransferase involved in cell wall biosynthesis
MIETDIHLFLFMTKGMSLAKWRDLGMLRREMSLYQRLRPRLAGVTIVSDGGREDDAVIAGYPGIDVVCNRWRLPRGLYRRLLPGMLQRMRRGTAIYKSNQISGAERVLLLARVAGAPFIARCGYMLSEFKARAEGYGSVAYREAAAGERRVFNAAAHCIVTTQSMKRQVIGYGVPAHSVSIVPNYVDTALFCSPGDHRGAAGREERQRIVFVGRIAEQKNPLLLIEALEGLDVALDMVGQGELRDRAEEEARRRSVAVTFHGNLPHECLPEIINAGRVFVLPSHYEGHPKTLLEAMACAAAVIGTDVPGIREVIDDGRTGLLCEPTVVALRAAIERLLGDDALRRFLGDNARHQVGATLSLDRVMELELEAYQTALTGTVKETHFGT